MKTLLLLCALSPQDVETFPCDTTAGWTLTDFAGGAPKGATLSAAETIVVLRYRRDVLSPLVHAASLAEMREIRLTIRSASAATLALSVQDRDGAGFNATFSVPAGKWTKVRLKPADFKLNDDSKVKKKSLEPRRLGSAYILIDAGAITGEKGINTLQIDEVVIEREDLVKKSELVVDRPMEISASTLCEGKIHVKKGGRLKITAPRFILRGDVRVDDGTIEIAGGLFMMPQRFNHEREITLLGTSRLAVKDAHFVTVFPVTLNLGDASAYEVVNVEFQGGVTCTMTDKGRVSLEKAASPGEFVIAPGAEVSVKDSNFVILWLAAGANLKGKLTFPPGDKVEDWSAGHGMKVRVRNCTNMVWCFVSTAGSDATVENTQVYAAGLYFDGESKVAFKGLHNGNKVDDYALDASDRKLKFYGATVRAWNFYANGKASITVDRCTFGETLTFGEGRVEICDSTCDGSGGYVGSLGKSEIRLTGCKLTCLVLARDESRLILENCEIVGDVRAIGTATIRLTNCRVTGKVEAEEGAKIIEK